MYPVKNRKIPEIVFRLVNIIVGNIFMDLFFNGSIQPLSGEKNWHRKKPYAANAAHTVFFIPLHHGWVSKPAIPENSKKCEEASVRLSLRVLAVYDTTSFSFRPRKIILQAKTHLVTHPEYKSAFFCQQ